MPDKIWILTILRQGQVITHAAKTLTTSTDLLTYYAKEWWERTYPEPVPSDAKTLINKYYDQTTEIYDLKQIQIED